MKLVAGAVLAKLALGAVSGAEARDKRQRGAYQPRIICGQTGCFEIPPGCLGELRRTGKSVVAVVMYDRRAQRRPMSAASVTRQNEANSTNALAACEYSQRVRSSAQLTGATVQFLVATLPG
jgi:hypothetical protein